MRSYVAITALLAVAIIVVCCAPAGDQPAAKAPTQAEDIAAINANATKYEAAFNAGNAAAVADLHTDDAIRMPPNGAAVVGKEAIRSWHQTGFDKFTWKIGLSSQEVEVAGDWAFARGSFSVTYTPKAGGESAQDAGKGLVIYRRQPDGSWKIHRAIWNSDQALPQS